MQVNRDLLFDSFRGIAIIAVVAIHAIYLGGSPDSSGFVYYRQLLNFSVPAFFFMSGYWASKKQIESLVSYKAFLSRKFFRICVPYLFWSFLLLGYSAFKKADFDGLEFTFKLFTGGACMGYYFVIAIAQLYIMTPLLQYMNRRLKWYGLMLVLVFNLAIIFVLYLSRLFHVISNVPIALPFYSWLIYYELGLFMGEHYSKVTVSSKIRTFIAAAILAFGFLSVLEASILLARYSRPDFAVSAVKYSSFLYSFSLILGFFFWRRHFRFLPRLLGVIGRYSFGVYLIHVIVLGQFVHFFQTVGFADIFQPAYQLVLVVVTIGLCMVLIYSSRALLPGSLCVKVLGF